MPPRKPSRGPRARGLLLALWPILGLRPFSSWCKGLWSTISSLIAKARERASAPGLTVASLHGSPTGELPHAATLGANCRKVNCGSCSVRGPAVLRLLALAQCEGLPRAFSLPTSVGVTVVASALAAHF